MSVDRACILLLSTKTWDLSGGRKGGFQSYREPLSIFELTTAVFLLIIMFIFFYIHKRIDLNSLKWSNIGRLIKLNSKQSEMIELYSIPSLLQFEFNIILGQYEMVCLNGIRSSSQQIELLKSINGRIIFVFALNGSGIYLTASFGIAHDDLDPAFTRLNKRFYSFENRIKLLIAFKGDPLLDGLNLIKIFESLYGLIMPLTTLNGSNKVLGRCINIFIIIIIKNYEKTIHLINQNIVHAYSHIKNKKNNLKKLKKIKNLINSLKINGPAPRLDLVTIYFQMKKIKTSFNILVRIGGPYPSHMKLVTTISLLLYVLIRFECKNTISKNYNNITGPTNAALTVVTSNIITNCYTTWFDIGPANTALTVVTNMKIQIRIISIISSMKNRLKCNKVKFLISFVRNINDSFERTSTIHQIQTIIKTMILSNCIYKYIHLIFVLFTH
eukprot:873025_1